jgi:exosortase A-associated hydrolase 1
MRLEEIPLVFTQGDEELIGILTNPADPTPTGVVIVVGGPQYRVGSHRQFTLLARHLAANGFATLRFDYAGMGDSSGAVRTFENVSDDIRAAVDVICNRVPAVKRVALWGLCDAASAALMYASTDKRVSSVALLNPWVRNEVTVAQAYLRHYYLSRLLSSGFWKKLLSGAFSPVQSLRSLLSMLTQAVGHKGPAGSGTTQPFQARMLSGLEAFSGRVLLVLSGRDLTAQEFADHVAASERWKAALARAGVMRHALPEADHTFSRETWRRAVEDLTIAWLRAEPTGSDQRPDALRRC